jgi:heme/copper-type cytochrome/quinol oxidase subunit 2
MLFILGVFGFIWSGIEANMALASVAGNEKARILAQCIASAFSICVFSLVGCFGYVFFYAVSIMIHRSRNKKASESLESSEAL